MHLLTVSSSSSPVAVLKCEATIIPGPGQGSGTTPRPRLQCYCGQKRSKVSDKCSNSNWRKQLFATIFSVLCKGGVKNRWGKLWHKLWLHFFWPTFWLHCILPFTYRGGFAPRIGCLLYTSPSPRDS